MSKRPPLTPEQQDLVSRNIGLAQHLAQAAARRSGGAITVDDVLSSAYEGLIKAAQAFDPERADVRADGSKDVAGAFSGYARIRINGAILDHQRRADHVNKSQRMLYKRIQSLGYGDGRSAAEVAELTGMTEAEVRRVSAAVKASPIAFPESEDQQTAEHGATSLESQVVASRIQQAFVDTLISLSPDTQVVVALRYYEGLSLSQIAEVLGMTLTRVQVLHADALDALYGAMSSEAS